MSLDFSPVDYTPDGVAVFGRDTSLLVKFFTHPQISKIKSDEAGRPVYDDAVMIEVINPGEKEPIRVIKTKWHEQRFPKQWENFQKGVQEIGSGTPLDHLFPNEPGTILTLNGFNVFTVDQLAAITDTAIGNIPMGRALVDRAKAYLSSAAGGSEFHKMQKTIADLTARLAEMEERAPQQAIPNPVLPPSAQIGTSSGSLMGGRVSGEGLRRGPGRPRNPVEGA